MQTVLRARLMVVMALALAALSYGAARNAAAQSGPGSLDQRFGAQGVAVTDLGGVDEVYGITIQSDGKIIAVGQTMRDGQFDLAMARYDRNGQLDPAFGSNGTVIVDLGGAEAGYAVWIDSDVGYIAVAGVRDRDFLLLRFFLNGVLDERYGNGGTVTVPIPGEASAALFDLDIDEDGSIVVAGTAGFLLAKFTPDGLPDPDFGQGGFVPLAAPDPDVKAILVDVQSDGDILVARVAGTLITWSLYFSDGELDLDYGIDGVEADTLTGLDTAYSLAWDAQGRMLVAGRAGGRSAVARYNEDLSLDASFGGGVVLTDSARPGFEPFGIGIVADANVVLGGTLDGNFALARFETVPAGAVMIADDFTSSANGILVHDATPGRQYSRRYTDGAYVITLSDPNYESFPFARLPGVYANASLAVDVRVVGDPTVQAVFLGCRESFDGQSEYRAVFDFDLGSVSLDRWVNGTRTRLHDDVRSSAIRRNNATNRVELTCTGNTITVSVNGALVVQSSDANIQEGRFWIGLTTFTEPYRGRAEAHFDNLTVTRR